MILRNPGPLLKTLPFFFGFCWLLHSPTLNAQVTNSLKTADTLSKSDVDIVKDTLTIMINPSPDPVIDEILIQPEICNQKKGSIEIISSQGTGPLRYSIDGISFQYSNSFHDLTAGLYSIYVMDETESTTMSTALIASEKSLSLSVLSSKSAECVDHNGAINMIVTGGMEPYFYSINNEAATLESQFPGLSPGTYAIHIEDAQGCSIDTSVIIHQMPCPLYIPNVFSPNGDGVNDLFQIRVNDDQNIDITRFYIFDRFGKKVYERFDLPARSNVGWWDGTFKHFTVSAGVYYYFLEVKYENGDTETFKGDLTLLR